MTETKTKKEVLLSLWRLCPLRCILTLAGGLMIALYFALWGNTVLMAWTAEHLVAPYHRAAGRLCSLVPFSVAELFYAAACILGLWYTLRFLRRMLSGESRGADAFRYVMTVLSAALCFYGGICLLWGIYYHSYDFEAVSGIRDRPVSLEELQSVTAYFADQANTYAELVPRRDGLYAAETAGILDRSLEIYRAVEGEYPFLQGRELRPKAMVFSKFMSWINFTGFFFPFTGEANLNVGSPVCLLPATAAHEIAHQRGIAPENEANFIAVLACMRSDDLEFRYSGALLAYIHLGNALYSQDPDAYWAICNTLNENVRADLDSNNAYWAKYETKAAQVSETVYTGFLQSQGQSLGMQSYGACVDLLVSHYIEEAGSC